MTGMTAISTEAKRMGRGLLAAILIAAALHLAAAAGAQDAGDDYGALSSEVLRNGTASVLVTGWHAVTGDEPDVSSSGGGLVAVTGDEFLKSVEGTGGVTDVRRFEHLPAIAMTVDGAGLAAAKGYGAGVRLWHDRPVELFLADSGPMVGAHRVHRAGYTGKGTFIAVIDTGTDLAHPFIAGRPVIEACFADRCPNGRSRMVGPGAARPVKSHGTHVAGIALGRGREMLGVAPEAGLIAINVLNPGGKARNSNILGALDWLIGMSRTQPIRIASINMSLGAAVHFGRPCRDPIYELTARLLAQRNVVIVAAAGNEGKAHGISHPACVGGIVSVGAVDKEARVAGFSNSAPILDLLAPGVDILSSVPCAGGGCAPFKERPGTSMAAPHVAGAYALLREAAPHASLQDLYRALVRGGRKVRDRRNDIVKPTLDVAGALAELRVGGSGERPKPAPKPEPKPQPPKEEPPKPAPPKTEPPKPAPPEAEPPKPKPEPPKAAPPEPKPAPEPKPGPPKQEPVKPDPPKGEAPETTPPEGETPGPEPPEQEGGWRAVEG